MRGWGMTVSKGIAHAIPEDPVLRGLALADREGCPPVRENFRYGLLASGGLRNSRFIRACSSARSRNMASSSCLKGFIR